MITCHCTDRGGSTRTGRFTGSKKPAGLTGFYRFNYLNGLLSEPDRFRLWFGLLAVQFGPVRSK